MPYIPISTVRTSFDFEDMQAPQNKHHNADIGPSKNCTDETTSVNKSLNFGDFQAQNQGGNGTRQKVTVKSEMKEPRSTLTNHHLKPSKSCTEETSQTKAY